MQDPRNAEYKEKMALAVDKLAAKVVKPKRKRK